MSKISDVPSCAVDFIMMVKHLSTTSKVKKSLSSGLQGWVFMSKKTPAHKSSLKILAFFCEIISFLDVSRELVDFLLQSRKRNITHSFVKVKVFIGTSFMGDTCSQGDLFLTKDIRTMQNIPQTAHPIQWCPNANQCCSFHESDLSTGKIKTETLFKERGLDWTSGNDQRAAKALAYWKGREKN